MPMNMTPNSTALAQDRSRADGVGRWGQEPVEPQNTGLPPRGIFHKFDLGILLRGAVFLLYVFLY